MQVRCNEADLYMRLLLAGRVSSQLLTPTMVCEMRCLDNLGAPQSLTYADPRAQTCRDYCKEHAYECCSESFHLSHL